MWNAEPKGVALEQEQSAAYVAAPVSGYWWWSRLKRSPLVEYRRRHAATVDPTRDCNDAAESFVALTCAVHTPISCLMRHHFLPERLDQHSQAFR
jgi:hypothetical protein